MYPKILIAFDGSPGASLALERAATVAPQLGVRESCALWVQRKPLASTGVTAVIPEALSEDVLSEEVDEENHQLDKLTARVHAVARQHEMGIEMDSQLGNHPAPEIIDYALDENIDLIVLGNNGHSELRGRLFGHTVDAVLEAAPCSILVVKQKPEYLRPALTYDRIIVGFDDSRDSRIALHHALTIGKESHAEVRAIWAADTPFVRENFTMLSPDPATFITQREWETHEQHEENLFHGIIEPDLKTQARAEHAEVSGEMIRGDATDVLVREAEARYSDLIVLGHRAHRKIWHRLFGGTTDRVCHRAQCDVLVVCEKPSS